MLYWHFRNLQCILAAFFQPKLRSPLEITEGTFWANPFDTDWFNAIRAQGFITYTDAFRWNWGVRTGFFKAAIKHKWVVIAGGQKLVHRRPVKLFRRFQLSVKFLGWDDKWIYVQHTFRQNGEVKCVSFIKSGIRRGGVLLPPKEMFRVLGFVEELTPPAWCLRQFEGDKDIIRQ
jgi:hypothetical protein